MNSNASQPPAQTPSETAVARRDRALRLRTRVLFSTVTSAVLAVGGLGVLAEHTYAGRSTIATTPASATSGSSSSNSSSSTSGATVSTSAPSSSSGQHRDRERRVMSRVAAPPELRSGWLMGGGSRRSRSEPELS